MGSIGISNGVLNQKGSPAIYSDIYANRPNAGFNGRLFVSIDTGQIFEDTGSTWTLIADAGVGGGTLSSVCVNGNTTATGITITANGLTTNSITQTNLTSGSVLFAGTGGTITQDNTNLSWDNTLKRLSIGPTGTPTAILDIHGTDPVMVQLNNTTTADSKLSFLNGGVGKWRIGNLYNAGANSFHIFNNSTSSNALTITSANAATFIGSLTAQSLAITGGTSSQFLKANGTTDSTAYISLTSLSATSPLSYNSGTGAFSILQSNTSQSGYLSSTDWNTFNNKASLGSFSASSPLSYNSGTGAFSIQVANSGQSGYLSSTDWNTFNNKQSALTFGNLTETVSSVLTITGGTNAVIGSGTTIQIKQSSSIQSGYLSSTDWNTFNNKATQLNGTGFVKASGTTITYDNSTYYLASNPSNYITLTSLGAATPLVYNNLSGGFSINLADTSTNGYLSSTDWNTFNNKQGAITLTTTGTSGAATLVGNTLNIPQYSGGGGMEIGGSITSATAGSVLYAGASGVLAQSNANFYYDYTNNRLGLGTASPSYKLDVYGTGGTIAQIKDGSTYCGLVIDAHSSSTPFTRFSSSGTGKFELGYYGSKFYFNNNVGVNDANAAMVINSSGNVGIGTTSPTSLLHLISAGSSIMKFSRSTNPTTYGFEIGATTFGLYDYTNTIWRWRVNNTDLLLNETSGNVGIGTSTIGSKLQIFGSAAIGYSASTAAPTNGLAVAGDMAVGTNTASTIGGYNGITTNGTTGSYQFFQVNGVNNGRLLAQSTNFLIQNVSTGDLIFSTNGAAPTTRGSFTSTGGFTLTTGANISAIAQSGYSLTGANAQSLLDLAGTWNTTGNPTAIKLNITNTASGSTSNLMDLQVGGVSKMSVDKSGNLTANNVLSGTYTPTLTNNFNISSSSIPSTYYVSYIRVGNVVIVSGKVNITPTSVLSSIQLYLSLPISSSATIYSTLIGTATNNTNSVATPIFGGVYPNLNQAEILFYNQYNTSYSTNFQFSYVIS